MAHCQSIFVSPVFFAEARTCFPLSCGGAFFPRDAGLAVDRTERSARSTRCPRTWGVLVAPLYICTVLFPASIFTFSFLNFMCSNFHLQPFLFLLNFLSRNFVSHLSPIFQSQNLLLGLFWLPNFFLYKNFAPRLFSSKFIDVKIF